MPIKTIAVATTWRRAVQAAIIKLTVRELVLATQVILRERFCVSLEPVRLDRVTRYTAKDGFRGSQYITYCSGSQTPQWKDQLKLPGSCVKDWVGNTMQTLDLRREVNRAAPLPSSLPCPLGI